MRYVKMLSVIVIMLAACSQRDFDDRPVITTSILPQKFIVERIAGEQFRINVLVPPGANHETYEPTPVQMQDVAKSLIYFRIGFLDFERTILQDISRGSDNLLVIDTAEGMDMLAAEIVDHGDHVHLYGVDPHIWLSPPAVRVQADNITGALIEADPGNRDYYLDNYSRFVAELDHLHESFTEKFSDVKRRTFLIFHPALGYFARDYNLIQISIEEEGKNPSAANMKRIVDLARKEDLRDVLIQMEFERESARAVARELGGEVVEINPLAENWLETMKDIAGKLFTILNK